MTTTSLKLPDELKQRAISAAQRRGMSPHAFMLEAIERTVCAEEQRTAFIAEALAAERDMLEAGMGFAAGDVHRHIRARIAGEVSQPLEPLPWRR